MEREAARQADRTTSESTVAELIKWSYADSPYCSFEDENFNGIKQLFLELPA
ncbi:DUF4303 domain-containing protein [Paenibacillus gorillae]|uniref:DUF4303 domain-containing protein n=1 Tax=Paenibacillus gorillae TaxID=1243662 RepID=UPI001EE16DD8|nr:DUF4303 domain-containing protein [Paenibacillus gorillae]